MKNVTLCIEESIATKISNPEVCKEKQLVLSLQLLWPKTAT